jgi:hypothetical protein
MDNDDKIQDLETRLARTVNAAYHALLEATAWMGIPQGKRESKIRYLMENIEYCAKNDLRYLDKIDITIIKE